MTADRPAPGGGDHPRRPLDLLPEADLRGIALARMEGHRAEGIAERLGCAPRTLQR